MDDQLRQAVLGAGNIQAPAAPNQAFATPELQQAAQIDFQLPQSSIGADAIAKQAQMDVNAAEQAAAAEKQRKAAMLDPSKYLQIPKEDGGYAFLDPEGKEISAHDYARVKGVAVDKVLADSENPIDAGFLEDYNNLQNYANAKLNSAYDPEAKAAAQEIERQVKEQFGEDLSTMDIKQLVERFQRAYPTVYGLKKPGVTVGRTFIPGAQSADGGAGAPIGG
jgi:hypothetical protein